MISNYNILLLIDRYTVNRSKILLISMSASFLRSMEGSLDIVVLVIVGRLTIADVLYVCMRLFYYYLLEYGTRNLPLLSGFFYIIKMSYNVCND